MKKTQTLEAVYTHAILVNNKQAKIISFINNTKKTDYKQNAQKLKTKILSLTQKIA